MSAAQDSWRCAEDASKNHRYIIRPVIILPFIDQSLTITDNFEAAALPTTTPEERKRLLSFVVCGGGPTGVEAAAEIYDLCQEDIINYVSPVQP